MVIPVSFSILFKIIGQYINIYSRKKIVPCNFIECLLHWNSRRPLMLCINTYLVVVCYVISEPCLLWPAIYMRTEYLHMLRKIWLARYLEIAKIHSAFIYCTTLFLIVRRFYLVLNSSFFYLVATTKLTRGHEIEKGWEQFKKKREVKWHRCGLLSKHVIRRP